MKTASKVLGIVGGALSILISAVSVLILTVFTDGFFMMDTPLPEFFKAIIYVVIAVGTVGGILGIVGGCFVGRNNVLAGVFMAVGAAASLGNNGGMLSGTILILGAVFAFLRDKPAQTQSVAPPQPDTQLPPTDTAQ